MPDKSNFVPVSTLTANRNKKHAQYEFHIGFKK